MEDTVAQLKRAIDANDLNGVKSLMLAHPELHSAPLGYGKDGPLTWVAECRVPFETPNADRLAMAEWMIENGSDVQQGGDGPLMRAALNCDRIPMMELLVKHGADVNARWHGSFPIIFAACECVDAEALRWLLAHGADPNCGALDYVIGSYVRGCKELHGCIEALLEAGAVGKYDAVPGVVAVLRGRLDLLGAALDAEPELVNRQFAELDFGTTGGRLLTLAGGTLLHVAAEYGEIDAMRLLLKRGADVNARAGVMDSGVGGQTSLFHAASQSDDFGFEAVQLLVKNGADLSIRAKVPGHYERPGETIDCTALEYGRLFPGGESRMVTLLEGPVGK